MGRHTRSACRPDAVGSFAQAASVLLNSQLLSYRAAVDDLVTEADRRWRSSGLLTLGALVAERLKQPEFASVLSRLDGGVDVVAARFLGETRKYSPGARDSASDLLTFARVFLLAQIDSAWWGGTAPFVSDDDVLGSADLVDLAPLRSARLLRFQYRRQPAGLPGRARDWARRQALPALRPHTAGLRFPRSRPAVIAVLNQVARDLAGGLPPRTPRPWVTSLVRSVEHQHRLRSLGYAAVLPSSHCVGYACDVEMEWFRRFDRANLFGRLLLERQEAGQLNVIDEGQVWHLCVNPLAHDELQAAYDAQLAGH